MEVGFCGWGGGLAGGGGGEDSVDDVCGALWWRGAWLFSRALAAGMVSEGRWE